MKTLKRILWSLAFCGMTLFGANDAEAVSSGAEVRMLLEQSADLMERMGFTEEADQSREQIEIASDDELFDLYQDIDLEGLVLAQTEAVEAMERANDFAKVADQARLKAANERSASKGGAPRKDLQDADLPAWDESAALGGYSAPAGSSASNIANWNFLRGWRTTMQALNNGLQIAIDAVPICEAVAGQIYAGGGIGVCVGANAALSCMPLSVAVTVLRAQFAAVRSELNYELARQESADYFGYRLDQSRTDLVYRRAGYLDSQLIKLDENLGAYDTRIKADLTKHDDDMERLLREHDDDIELKLSIHDEDIKEWLARIQDKANLALKTQMENMLTSNGGARSGMAYLARLEEVCDLASEAITDATNAGYRVSPKAQELLAEGIAQIDSDPKRAHDDCRSAYQLAATRAIQRLPGFGGRK